MPFNPERILSLLRTYTDRRATPEEQQELMDWLAEHEDNGTFQAHIQQLLQDFTAEQKVEGVDWEKIYSAILAKRNANDDVPASSGVVHPEDSGILRPVHRVHFLKTSWFRYAAAVVVVAGAAIATGVLLNRSEDQPLTSDNKHLQADIAPGSNKAILTLADGSTIVLDEAANGKLASQGNVSIVKLSNGQISYRLQGAAQGRMLMNRMATPRGGQYRLTLPDGSRVWLNAESSISYPAAFVDKERNVEVSGEVYMEIAKNAKQPFVVKANGTEVRVLGTSFNINAYEDEEAIRTTLIEGSVKVLAAGRESLLRPGQQCSVVGGQSSVIINANIEQALAWKNGLFNFNNLSLRQILRQISRWYDIDVEYRQNVPSKNFNGEIQRDLNLSEVLDVLKEAGVHFTVEGKKLIVSP